MKVIVQQREGILRRWSAPQIFDDAESSSRLQPFYEAIEADNPGLARQLRLKSEIEFRKNWMIWGAARGGRRVRFER